ncbi:CHASE2 domain-containing protein [Pseudacidovorax sp. RU35E]|uniref:CHASE2 domain-containing protein n=1 Tax=Pseudacidovorax sp. RU35E TaxID=1907403 RepID=UPI0009546236|nr:adenylate/guanylate cyclase domain-containing protein [Pseudacidovorax sp. RU35E]SIQ69189.1 adenylate cyclase [Pseudacidovorax sp. RU35E]
MRRTGWWRGLRGHGWRIAVTLLPLLAGLAHTGGLLHLPGVDRLDAQIQDARLRLHAPRGTDPRIVIVDIDEPSLRAFGQWPWSRERLARLTTELTQRQQARALAFDMVFAEADRSSGSALLQALGPGRWPADAGFDAELARRAAALDPDGDFARAVAAAPGRVVMGAHFDSEATGAGVPTFPPPPVLPAGALPPGATRIPGWPALIASLPGLSIGSRTGFINVVFRSGQDGVVRAAPLLARLEAAPGGYYESLALATFRAATDVAPPMLQLAHGPGAAPQLTALLLQAPDGRQIRIPVGADGGIVVPYRRDGGEDQRRFRYVSAREVLEGRLAPGALRDCIVLVGASAAGLQDLRATPIAAALPGVEVHAHVLSGLLDGRVPHVPDYAAGYAWASLVLIGLLLMLGTALRSAAAGFVIGLAACGGLLLLNDLFYRQGDLVLPQAAALLAGVAGLLLNMSWGYFVESRQRRALVRLFGAYVPPQLVDDMAREPHRYTMRAESRVLTVMFCDMRGFTHLAEHMAPATLQALLHEVFTRFTEIVNHHGGTVDKYMGDCLMAFWGAPVVQVDHAERAVRAAQDIVAALPALNARHDAHGLPNVAIGIGLNSGTVVVGNMGSAYRRSYTAIGDAVNLAARLEGLCTVYRVPIVAGESTVAHMPDAPWRELGEVQVRGRQRGVHIYTPDTACRPADAVQP